MKKTNIALIKKEAKQKWAYELNNGVLIAKQLVNEFGAKLGDYILYEYEIENGKEKPFKILTNNVMKDYFYKNLKEYSFKEPSLFKEIPENIVRIFRKEKLTSTKLRQYYDSLLNIYNVYERKKEKEFDSNELKSDLNILQAKINYDVNRKNSKVPKIMMEFFEFNKSKVFEKNTDILEKFKVFKKHFEAVVAYSAGKLKDN